MGSLLAMADGISIATKESVHLAADIRTEKRNKIGNSAFHPAYASTRHESGSADSRLCPLFARSEEHTSELQSLMRISYAVFCLKKKKHQQQPYKTAT